jgi:hypothetical protein
MPTMTKSVLAIGIDPAFADLNAFPTLTPDLVRAYIDQQIDGLRRSGYAVESCLVDLGASAEDVVETVLRARRYDCVVLGAGLREPPELLLLFEKIVNLVHRLAPDSRIAFNTNPADTAEAVQRWTSGD